MSVETKVPSIPDVGTGSVEYILNAVKMLLDVREGVSGNKLDANVTYRDLVNLGMAKDATNTYFPSSAAKLSLPIFPPNSDPDGYVPSEDLTPPPAPENVQALGSIGIIFITWDQPFYKNHLQAEVWRAESDDIGAATLLGTSTSQGYMDSPRAKDFTYYYWVRFVSKAEVTGPYSKESASAQAATDPAELIKILEKEILNLDLVKDLSSRIKLIDGPSELVNSVNYRMKEEFTARVAAINAEAATRAQALLDEAEARGTAITNEQIARQSADEALAQDITTLTATVNDNNSTLTAAIQDEATARANADSAEALQRTTLATQLRGGYTGSDLGQVTTGLIFQERQARSEQDSALAQQISLLTAGVSGGFDPYDTFHFDSSADGWVGSNCTLSVGNGYITLTPTGSDPSISLSADFSPGFSGASYRIVKVRFKRVAGTGWVGKLRWKTSGHGFSSSYEKTIADPGIGVGTTTIVDFDVDGITDWTSGTILNIQILLGTSSDTFDIDWISIGRNAPAASQASILEEAIARAAADSAEATARELLSTSVIGSTNPSGVTFATVGGLIGSEKTARANADSTEVAARELLSTTLTGQATASGLTLSNISGIIGEERTARADADTSQTQITTGLQSQVNLKTKVYQQATQPTSPPAPLTSFTVGDLWIDTSIPSGSSTSANKMYRWTGSAWVETTDARIGTLTSNVSTLQETYNSLDTAVNGPTGLAVRMSSVETVAGSKNKTFRQTTAPPNTNNALVVGDIWFNTNPAGGNNTTYRWDGSAWVITEDARIPQTAAAVVNVEQTKIGYATRNSNGEVFDNNGTIRNSTDVATWNAANPGNLLTWNVGIPFASAVKQVHVSDGLSSVALEQRFVAQRNTNNDLFGQYSVKIDNNGHVSGFGLSSTAVNGTPTSAFIIRADKFAIVDPASTANNLTNSPSVDTVPFAYTSGSANPYVPAGVYIKSAFIQNASISSAQIASLTANKITTGYINAVVGINGAKTYGTELYAGGSTSVQTDINGNVIGFTAHNPTLSIVNGVATFVASSFRIANSASGTPTNVFPFKVEGGVTYLDTAVIKRGTITTAMIENAEITSAQITSIVASKIVPNPETGLYITANQLTLDANTLTSSGGLLTISGGAITNQLIATNANIDGAKIANLNVSKLTGDVTKFITSRVTPSGYVPTSSDNVYMTVYLPASTHPEGHYPYIQVNVIDAYYAPVGLYMRIESARVGDGTSTPAIGPLTPVSQTLDLQFNGEMGYYQWGWSLTFSGSLDIDVGDTIISNEGAEGTVTSVSFTGTQTIVYVSQQYAPLGVTYTRTRPTLAPGQVGTYTSMAYTLWDAYDMSSVVIFAGSGITKQPRSFRIKVWAQSANAIHIESINAVVMGIR